MPAAGGKKATHRDSTGPHRRRDRQGFKLIRTGRWRSRRHRFRGLYFGTEDKPEALQRIRG